MKIDKINLNGKTDKIEVLDNIVSAKINKKLVSSLLYKVNANKKMKLLDQLQKFMLKKEQVMQDMLAEKHQYLLVVV